MWKTQDEAPIVCKTKKKNAQHILKEELYISHHTSNDDEEKQYKQRKTHNPHISIHDWEWNE